MYKFNETTINEIKDKVILMGQTKSFPVFDIDKKVNFEEEYPFYSYADYIYSEEIIKVNNIVGDNWAFENNQERGNYPRTDKILNILDAYKGIYLFGNNKLPNVPLDKVDGRYLLSEGNHRLYTLKLLESFGLIQDSLIKVKVRTYKYEEFLKNISFMFYSDSRYIKFPDNSIEEIDEFTYTKLLELQKKLHSI